MIATDPTAIPPAVEPKWYELGMTDSDVPGYWWRCVLVPLGAATVGFVLTRQSV